MARQYPFEFPQNYCTSTRTLARRSCFMRKNNISSTVRYCWKGFTLNVLITIATKRLIQLTMPKRKGRSVAQHRKGHTRRASRGKSVDGRTKSADGRTKFGRLQNAMVATMEEYGVDTKGQIECLEQLVNSWLNRAELDHSARIVTRLNNTLLRCRRVMWV